MKGKYYKEPNCEICQNYIKYLTFEDCNNCKYIFNIYIVDILSTNAGPKGDEAIIVFNEEEILSVPMSKIKLIDE